jgi:hypothetical protein
MYLSVCLSVRRIQLRSCSTNILWLVQQLHKRNSDVTSITVLLLCDIRELRLIAVLVWCQEDTGLGGKKRGKLYRYKEIFFGAKILVMIRHIYFQSCGAHFYRDQLLVSRRKETTLQHLTTFYNILQHFTLFTTFYNIHTTFTTFYNIFQHYPWRCVVSPKGR